MRHCSLVAMSGAYYVLLSIPQLQISEMQSEMSNFDGLPLSREMQDLQNRFNTMMQRINSNSKVAAFVNSSLGQYLDEHPFLALLLIVFTIMSAVPVGLFLIFAVITSLLACIGFIVMEGVLLSVGGVVLLCFLCGMILISLAISSLLAMCYFTFSTTMNYYHSSSIPSKKGETIISSTTKLCPEDTESKSTLKLQ
ncbi:lipid droplet assembly factor 1-A-like isoform X1 [Hypanus sabinus]|uniref:lipid droplet assembly factor 1-A-like isoform X1 n=1 Tax=Hypanus sabinus TaxID=79690 RepID=UPI0028C3C038|nr:lipid droplet assembly factor 1-A-like isoform X1 [Hypanus sabinus]